MINKEFWQGRRVFLTGHTGFKGSWLCLWLHALSAEVTGYALPPPVDANLFESFGIADKVTSIEADIRDFEKLNAVLQENRAEIVIHMAAQPLVRYSYEQPRETYEVNVMGTVNLLDAVRRCGSVRAVINVTTDKCYENKERTRGYVENDALGGYDPYSNSKACSEMVTAAYRSSFFSPARYTEHGVALATARAGNVIGGGDWAADRLVPDCMRSLLRGRELLIRYPWAVRPWQHVLEPLCGYLLLAEQLVVRGPEFGEAWNFGPDESDNDTVIHIVEQLYDKWGAARNIVIEGKDQPHETCCLRLKCAKVQERLGYGPRWNIDQALGKVVDWTKAYARGEDMAGVGLQQIDEFMNSQPLGCNG